MQRFLLLFASIAAVLIAGTNALCADMTLPKKTSEDPLSGFATYTNYDYWYEVKYPKKWKVVEAKAGDAPQNAEDMDVLFEEEVHKVTFLEKPAEGWRGEFQIRVLSNPDKLNLEQWIATYKVVDEAGKNLIKSISNIDLAEKHSKRFAISGDNYEEIEIVTIYESSIYSLIFMEDSINISNREKYKSIYDTMLSTFKFIE